MGGPEGIIDIDVSVGGKLLAELGVVLLLVLVQADVLQENNLQGWQSKLVMPPGEIGFDLPVRSPYVPRRSSCQRRRP